MKHPPQNIRKKIVLFASAITTILFVGLTNIANAAGGSLMGSFISGVGYDFFSSLAFGITYIIAAIFGIVIAVETWLLGIVLTINEGVLQTPTVQTGFSISLSIANLAFVLGIIVIAIATILRNNNYGIKQLLWKLVVMAILVNFGLVIMAPIYAIGNSITQYFMSCIGPVSGGCTGTSSSASSFNNFAMTFTEAFNPQAPIASLTNASSGADSVILSQGKNSSLGSSFSTSGAVGSDIGAMVVPIFGIFFTLIDLALIDFVLGVFIVLLFIRYIYIAILAILLPFAWASWVFPSFSYHWKDWWNKFLQWTFFAPIVLFFIYISLVWAKNMGATFSIQTYANPSNSLWVAINNFLSGIISPILEAFVQEIILAGLILGGMIAGNSMGIKLAGSAVKMAENGGRAVQGYVGKQSKKVGRAAFRKAGGEKAVTAMREGRLGGLQKIPVLGWAAGRGASLAGRAIQPNLNNRGYVDEAKKKVSEDTNAVEANLKGNMNMEDTLAHVAKLTEKGKLRHDTMIGNKTIGEWMDTNKTKIEQSYGSGKIIEDANIVIGSNAKMRAAKTDQEKQAATDEFVAKLEKSDIPKMNVNKIFGQPDISKGETENPFAKNLANSFATTNTSLASSAIPKMKGETKDKFADTYLSQIESEHKNSQGLQDIDRISADIKNVKAQRESDATIKRLRSEIKNVRATTTDLDEQKKKIDALTGQINDINDEYDEQEKKLQQNIDTVTAGLSKREKNVLEAAQIFKKTLDANATFGIGDPTSGSSPSPH